MFEEYLEKIGEIGYVEEMMHSIVYASGIPGVKPYESVIFENGNFGQIISMTKDRAEILVLGNSQITVGMKLARTGDMLQVPVGDEYVGRMIDPLGNPMDSGKPIKNTRFSAIDTQPHGMVGRKQVEKPLETGVTIVDLVIPLAKGQRELVIGDRKTGKTEFLLQMIMSQAKKGTICIYAIIGQRQQDIMDRYTFFKENNISDKVIIIATSSSDTSGLIYITPFSAITVAEFYRDKGFDVLLILDDMTTHARIYREISLLAKRFPGRNSYPGDIFYLHSRIMERAGNFKRGSITAIPVAETVMGDLSGYLQTNLMGMTDGHIFFDIDLFNQGKRPAVSPYLSVTRVGHKPQSSLLRDISRELLGFLVRYEKMKQFVHFGAEAGETIKGVLEMGKRIDIFFTQNTTDIVPLNINALILGGIWAGVWNETKFTDLKNIIEKIINKYTSDQSYQKTVDQMMEQEKEFIGLVNKLRNDDKILLID